MPQALSASNPRGAFYTNRFPSRSEPLRVATHTHVGRHIQDPGRNRPQEAVPSGLTLIVNSNPFISTRVVVMIGYVRIRTTVEAIASAAHYLTKPTDADKILAALHRGGGNSGASIGAKPILLKRIE